MSIQLITKYGAKPFSVSDHVSVTGLKNPFSFDEHEITVIDLQDDQIWRNKRDDTSAINDLANIKHLATLIDDSKTSQTLVLLPSDCKFLYHYPESSGKY